jgi:cystathionine gamma-synthase
MTSPPTSTKPGAKSPEGIAGGPPDQTMRDLLTDPAWREEDLGCPLPDSPHAVSVAIPTWAQVVGYEEKDVRVTSRFRCGYPRFFLHPLVQRLRDDAAAAAGRPGETVLVFPSDVAARRCLAFVGRGRVEPWKHGLAICAVPDEDRDRALLHWRLGGEIVSSRRAAAALEDRPADESGGQAARRVLRERIAAWTGQSAADVHLFASGMAAFSTAHRLAMAQRPERPTLQIEFPYVDALKVQQEAPGGAMFLPNVADWASVERRLDEHPPAAVFCEIASNPQLRTADLAALAPMLRRRAIPLVVDDTVSSVHNVDVYPYADLVTTSLTKWISGAGDVLAGCVVLNRASPWHSLFRTRLAHAAHEPLWADDAVVLEANSRDFPERMARINATADALRDFLAAHPRVERVWHPRDETPAAYESLRRPGGGHGGLLSFLPADPSGTAPAFYDRWQVNKGPSLGTNFTLACPYLLLAHYAELDWCASLGMDRHLIRLSVGLEDPEVLLRRLDAALRG